MKTNQILTGLAVASVAAAQRPADQSICDYYTTALLEDNTAENQQTLLTLVVNTAVIGNYTTPNVGIAVPGILTPGNINGVDVNLAPYFTGALKSTNGGDMGVSVNFLDGGAAAPLMANMPANSTSSAQYNLLTHLYGYFGYLLGCSEFSNTTSPYTGSTSMYKVHKFMGLDVNEVGYFIQQVGLSAASFGVADADVAIVGKALNDAFGYRCSAPAAIPASAEPELQSICIADNCPIAPNATCSAYSPVMEPQNATSPANMTMPSATGSMPSSTLTPYTGAASAVLPAVSTLLVAAVGMFFLL